MTQKQTPPLSPGTHPAESLTQVLMDSEHVRGMVKESADELASVNTVLNEELARHHALPEVTRALEQSGAIENKVQEASQKLSQVNASLEHEVQKRQILEQELTQMTAQQQQTLHAAMHDPLTGLPNRVLFQDRLAHGIAQAKRHRWTLAVMFLDLDNFKAINDAYGHDTGDAVLLTIATRLKETTRTDDTVSRHGGDEFLYLLMEIEDDHGIATVAKKILNAVQLPCEVNGRMLEVNTSIGISIFPKDGTTVVELIMRADAAMYRAKQNHSGYAFASGDPWPSHTPA